MGVLHVDTRGRGLFQCDKNGKLGDTTGGFRAMCT